jgi:microcystin-dependent protein
MGTGAYSTSNTDTNPPYSNPYYNQGTSAGTNTVTLGLGQIPSHNHAGSTSTDTGHIHNIFANVNYGTGTSGVKSGTDFFIQGGTHSSDSSTANINLTIAQAGGGQAHSNIQPVLGVLYIMYIP